jgi:hypothetical protein
VLGLLAMLVLRPHTDDGNSMVVLSGVVDGQSCCQSKTVANRRTLIPNVAFLSLYRRMPL